MERIVIWITCHKYEEYLLEAVLSAHRQTVKCEIHVQHDACQPHHDPFGVARSRNAFLAHPLSRTATRVIFLDADDVLPTDYVERLMEAAVSNDVVVACDAEMFGEETGRIQVRTPVTMDTLLEGNSIHCAALIPVSAFRSVNGYDPSLESHEDWDLWCRLVAEGYMFAVTRRTALRYRRHSGSRSTKMRSRYEEVRRRFVETYGHLVGNPKQASD